MIFYDLHKTFETLISVVRSNLVRKFKDRRAGKKNIAPATVEVKTGPEIITRAGVYYLHFSWRMTIFVC